MSDIIHLLPDSVANQIAAGEVIQRPASIIKELVENSLDAGATRIQVVVEDAGKSMVQVIDNGCGMSETDARLSFERHATSKIRQATDLFALRTMGFRGEALASIAAVAQVELRTRQEKDEIGTSLHIEGSKTVRQEPIACPVGANFAVRNLFFNIPARRKFLKSNQTELTNILTEFERIALAHPEVAFTLHSGGAVMQELPVGNFRQRIVNVFGKKIDSQLIPVDVDTTLAKIHGFVGMPTAARRKGAHQFFFVNGRFMRHPYFAKAVATAYERLVADGLQIPFFLKFEVDPARIDVNIHPTKTEIKFEDDNAIFQILLAAVREALGKFGAVPTIDFDVEGRPDIPTLGLSASPNYAVPAPKIHIDTSFNPFESAGKKAQSHYEETFGHDTFPSHHQAAARGSIDWQQVYANALGSENKNGGPESPTPNVPRKDSEGGGLYQHLPNNGRSEWEVEDSSHFLQYLGRYILVPLSEGLAIIDQHKAHLRILYERYTKQLQLSQMPSQRLLFPEMLTLSPSETVVFEQLLPTLHEAGFDISPLGSGSFSILAVPTGTEGIAPTDLTASILADAMTGQADANGTVAHIVALSLARKVAMPVGQALNADEMNELVRQLFTCATPNLTPDGNKTLCIINPENYF